MALIKCPECGKEISDKAHSCPNCGNPIAQVIPPPPFANLSAPVQPAPVQSTPATTGSGTKPSAPQVGIDTQKLKCPYCGEVLGPKDILSSGWAKCPTCSETIRLTGANGEFDDNVLIERIAPFSFTKEEYHNIFMQHFMDNCGENAYEKMRTVSITRKFFWVREFGRADNRVIYPMCQYGKDLFMKIKETPWLMMEDYERLFPTKEMVPFNSEDLRDTELVAKEMSASEVKLEFSHTKMGERNPTPNYYLLPVVEEVVEYEGQQYTFIGTANGTEYWYDMGGFPFKAMPSPDYTEMKPVLVAIWIIIGIIILIPIITGFAHSFWGTFFALVGIGILCAILSGVLSAVAMAISAIPIGIDTLICKSINKKRRTKFRREYAVMQEAKKESAKRRMNAEVTYEVPEFPIP
ncbi:MAG: zinc-ribbon domain-containing protein [Bacteroidales bacterium]|nr:zinc-ribbon domain-containing protein [Bacteroidales bacterium]